MQISQLSKLGLFFRLLIPRVFLGSSYKALLLIYPNLLYHKLVILSIFNITLFSLVVLDLTIVLNTINPSLLAPLANKLPVGV